ncbi:MAG TPA: glycosyltransferase family 4 protein [Puia sp.]|nr:glycosyltransferase family 4 protein [Puia sp.]
MSKKISLAYFLSHPIQYFSPLFKALAKATDLSVYYFSDASIRGTFDKGFGQKISWDIPLLEGYKSSFVKNHKKDRGLDNRFWDVWNPGVWKAVRHAEASIIIVNGWTYSSTWLAIIAARMSGKSVWLRAENPLNQELKKSRKVLWAKRIILKQFLFRYLVDRCLYIGTESRLFFEYYGVRPAHLIYTPYSVDNDFFRSAWSANRGRLDEIKQELGLPAGKKIVLFSGKFISKKRPLDILTAFAATDKGDYFLLMVGEGELRPEMEQFIRDSRLEGRVRLTGFVNQSEIPLYYSVADVFVMCSGMGETWGLAVNEAMNFEKPVIVSETCGCSTDLVQHGVNGYVFQEGNPAQLGEFLDLTLNSGQLPADAGVRSAAIVANFSIDRIVENILQAK